MANRAPMIVGEWYHCYTRGVDKRVVFETPEDHERFLTHLYLANSTQNIRASNFANARLSSILASKAIDRATQIVDLGAYALMPTHAHFLLRECQEHGIARFMQKVFTGYTMYFNNKNERTGALFSGTFKSKHIDNDRYLKQVIPYILFNPAELFEPTWKNGGGNMAMLQTKLQQYPYSSLPDFYKVKRAENKILNADVREFYDHIPSFAEMLRDAHEYYASSRPQV